MAVVTNIGNLDELEAAALWRLLDSDDKSEAILCVCILLDAKLIAAIRLIEAIGTRTIKEKQELHSLKLQRQECALMAARVYGGALPLDCTEFTAEVLRGGDYGEFDMAWRRLVNSGLYEAPKEVCA